MISKNPGAARAKRFNRKRRIVTSNLKIESRFLPIAPNGDGYMPLSAALHWIASKGLTCAPDAGPDANDQYRAAAKEFSAKGSSGKVRVIGAKYDRKSKTFPARQFATVRWCFLFNEADLFSEVVANVARIVIMPCGDDEQSEDQFWVKGNQPRLTMLQAYREDVRREWPFTLKQGGHERPAAERAGTTTNHNSADLLKRGHRNGEPWLHADVPLFEEMRRLLETHQAKDITAAARAVRERAANQGGTPESVAKRLARNYNFWIEAQPAE